MKILGQICWQALLTVNLFFWRKRLARPVKAELEVYATMEWCWEYEPAKRPKFSELFKIFSDNPEYSNLRDLLLTQDLQKLGMWMVVLAKKLSQNFDLYL